MSQVSERIENAAVGIAVFDDLQSFEIFKQPGVAAAIWRREFSSDFQNWISTLAVENLPSARMIVRTEVVRDAVETICGTCGMPYTLKRRAFVDDVVMLAERFAALMDANFLRIRFDVVQDDACRKFHIDAVTARLVCTYRGPGTQYGISADGSDPKRVFSVPTGAPMLLRGTKWPELPASGLLHRSPPIEGTGATRLVLVLDPISDE